LPGLSTVVSLDPKCPLGHCGGDSDHRSDESHSPDQKVTSKWSLSNWFDPKLAQ
jgi:hypothetical protein